MDDGGPVIEETWDSPCLYGIGSLQDETATYLFVQQLFIEYPLCSRKCPW